MILYLYIPIQACIGGLFVLRSIDWLKTSTAEMSKLYAVRATSFGVSTITVGSDINLQSFCTKFDILTYLVEA